ncbi:MAG: hypothetical protein ACKOXB_14200 [Flavobacteriales bacterium]
MKVEFKSSKKDQYVVYSQEGCSFKMSFEPGDDIMPAIINIPEDHEWVHVTQTRLSEKHNILEFIAQEVTEKIAPGGEYQITSNYIKIFKD